MAAETEHPVPTQRARELVRGGVDYHIHVAPDFVRRRITDVQLAKRCLETGQAGFGLKSHYFATAERAQVVGDVGLLGPGLLDQVTRAQRLAREQRNDPRSQRVGEQPQHISLN